MEKPFIPFPPPQDLLEVGRTLFREFNPTKFIYLNSRGEWRENPKTLRDRISHEFFFQFWKTGEKEAALFQKLYAPFLETDFWTQSKKLALSLLSRKKPQAAQLAEKEIDKALSDFWSKGNRPESSFSFLILLEILLWTIQYEATRLESEVYVCEWDREGCILKEAASRHHARLQKFLDCIFNPIQKEKFLSKIGTLTKEFPALIEKIAVLISEEDTFEKTIAELLEKAQDPGNREEIYSRIIERIQPPLGIVINAKSSLLRPCLDLLMNIGIDLGSGIQYMASVVLSILQDPRSTATLIRALQLFPLHCSKIRENIIYALGNLKAKKAVQAIAEVLAVPEERTALRASPQGENIQSFFDQKLEAIWALGKIGLESIKSLPALVPYADDWSPELKTYLAWTLGEIGKAQKEKWGGVAADIPIALLKLLKNKNRQIFEETVAALKKIQMPEFIHSLYLYQVGAVSILGLKPAQKGLYELSETLQYLLRLKKRTIMAVNGDSGTGKTYFCHSILDGFGDLKPQEILYLMRDRKQDQKIFNRMLGLRWLKRHIEPIYYHDYPLSEEEDNPEEYFQQFLEGNSDKKLIILDGCRDQLYFQRVIDLFYSKGELDVEVNFRATFSTRRLNLETREIALESVKTHLSFLEEPALEDTSFYQEGLVILYDLDNSIPSRLNDLEIKELFAQRKIDSWEDLIRIGTFGEGERHLGVVEEAFTSKKEILSVKQEKWQEPATQSFSPEERTFKPELNDDLRDEPNLLQTIPLEDIKANRIRFYAQDQIVGTGEEGNLFVLTFLDRHLFHTQLEKIEDIALQGRTLFLLNKKGELISLSFEKNEIARFKKTDSRAIKIASFPRDRVITGHEDGSIRIWDFMNKSIMHLEAHDKSILSLAVDYSGRLYSGSSDGCLRQWNLEKKLVNVIESPARRIPLIKLYPQEKILTLTENDRRAEGPRPFPEKIKIMDFEKNTSRILETSFDKKISSICVYLDGRIIAGLARSNVKERSKERNLIILTPGRDSWEYNFLSGHGLETKDCLTMGPKIITAGVESSGEHAIRIWGTEFYVRTELGKLLIHP
jgi:HEAT repeat protein